MRAVVVMAVLMLWLCCLVGAVGLTALLVVLGVNATSARQQGAARGAGAPPRGVIPALVAFAFAMAMFAGFLAWASWLGGVRNVLAWVALPAWTSVAAALSAVFLSRRRAPAPAAGAHAA